MDKVLDKLRLEIEEQLGWGPAAGWHSSMFDELSEKIFQVTGVNLSVATLKRFFNVVKYDGRSSITTLDALSRFLRYQNYRDFKLSLGNKSRTPKFKVPGKNGIYISLGFVLCLIIISLIANRDPEVVINASEFTFGSEVKSEEYPNTVVFNFSFPDNLKTDKLQIQQSWDASRTLEIRRDQSQATGIYYQPGYYRAKLLVEGAIVREHDLLLKSNGWLGTIDYAPVPKYFKPELSDEVRLKIPPGIGEEIARSGDKLVTTFHYVNNLGKVTDDHFSISTQVENHSAEPWAVCKMMSIYFLGTEGMLAIPFSKIGCSSDNNLMLNELFLSGKENDLSSLSSDFSESTDIEVSVQQRKVIVNIAGQEVYSNRYERSIGQLVGLRFRFLGTGQINEIHLFDQNQEEIPLD